MRITVTFDPQYSIWEATATEDSRPMFTNVLIDPSGLLVATDRFVLGIVKADVCGLDKPVVVKAEAFEAAAKEQRGRRVDVARLTLDMRARRCSVDMGTHIRRWPFFDGTFPNWRAIVPDFSKLVYGIPIGGYSPELAMKARQVVGGQGVTGAGLGPEKPFVVVDTKGMALAIVMPTFQREKEVMDSLRETYRNLGLIQAAQTTV